MMMACLFSWNKCVGLLLLPMSFINHHHLKFHYKRANHTVKENIVQWNFQNEATRNIVDELILNHSIVEINA